MFLIYTKNIECVWKKLTPKKYVWKKNVNHVFEKMFNKYIKMFHVLEWKVKHV